MDQKYTQSYLDSLLIEQIDIHKILSDLSISLSSTGLQLHSKKGVLPPAIRAVKPRYAFYTYQSVFRYIKNVCKIRRIRRNNTEIQDTIVKYSFILPRSEESHNE